MKFISHQYLFLLCDDDAEVVGAEVVGGSRDAGVALCEEAGDELLLEGRLGAGPDAGCLVFVVEGLSAEEGGGVEQGLVVFEGVGDLALEGVEDVEVRRVEVVVDVIAAVSEEVDVVLEANLLLSGELVGDVQLDELRPRRQHEEALGLQRLGHFAKHRGPVAEQEAEAPGRRRQSCSFRRLKKGTHALATSKSSSKGKFAGSATRTSSRPSPAYALARSTMDGSTSVATTLGNARANDSAGSPGPQARSSTLFASGLCAFAAVTIIRHAGA
mmetsp:Transcript_3004/g.10005  ORF Transcript_3004/g.10005 Transcript_3004/m.10005 type:complete len:272 (+) Transcript_3004:129-944(+)